MYVLYKTFSKSLCNRLSNYFFPNKKTVLCREEIYFRIFLSCKTRFRFFYTERPSINVTACLTSKPLISRFSNKSIINFTAVRPFSVTS